MHDLPGVDDPDEWDEEGVEEEHHRLLLCHSVLLAVDVVEGEVFDEQGHEGGREEEAEGVLEAE